MEEVKDTSKIQLASLKSFMGALGYQYYGVDKVFCSSLYINRSRPVISYNKAILLHNGYFFEWHGRVYDPPFDNIPAALINNAMLLKIVEVVKQQYSRKKGIITQNHMVKFTEYGYSTEYGKSYKFI